MRINSQRTEHNLPPKGVAVLSGGVAMMKTGRVVHWNG